MKLSNEDLKIVEMFGHEICVLGEMIEDAPDQDSADKLRQEQSLLIMRVNRILGTDHLAGKMSTINNDLNIN